MQFPPVKPGFEIVVDMINAKLGTSYLVNQVTIGNPAPNSTSGRNTRVEVTLPSQGETETLTALYNRLSFNELFSVPYSIRFEDAFVTKADILPRILADRGIFILEGVDVLDSPLGINRNTTTFPVNLTYEAQANSLSFTGQFTVRVEAPLALPDPDPEEDDMHYRAYPSDEQLFALGGRLINIQFGQTSSCGLPTPCVSSHPVNDETVSIVDYSLLQLVSATIYRHTGSVANDGYEQFRSNLLPGRLKGRNYSVSGMRTVVGQLVVGSSGPDSITLVPDGISGTPDGEILLDDASAVYQVIAQFTYPGVTKPIFFYMVTDV